MLHKRNDLMSEALIRRLAARHINAYYCKTSEEAISKVLELLKEGSTISWGGSATIRDMGLVKALHEKGCFNLLDRDLVATPEETKRIYHEALMADYYLTSCNAMTQNGEIVNIDGNGNRVAAITYGPEKVIHVVGMNKVVATLEDAISRARNLAAPVNVQRFSLTTPCQKDGMCHDCHQADCICSYIHIMRNSRTPGRHTVILVDEELGY